MGKVKGKVKCGGLPPRAAASATSTKVGSRKHSRLQGRQGALGVRLGQHRRRDVVDGTWRGAPAAFGRRCAVPARASCIRAYVVGYRVRCTAIVCRLYSVRLPVYV